MVHVEASTSGDLDAADNPADHRIEKSGTSAGDPLPLEDLRPDTSAPEYRPEALADKTLEPGVQCPQNRSRCVSRFPSMRCCRLRIGRSQVFSRKPGSASESPRVRLTGLQNEAAATKVIRHEDRPHASLAGSLFDPDSRTSLPPAQYRCEATEVNH